jgi:hypothetical protein
MVNWPVHKIMLSSSFSWWFPQCSLISLFLLSTLPSLEHMKLRHPALSPHAVVMFQYSAQHNLSPGYTEHRIHWPQQNAEYIIHRVLHTRSTAYVESLHMQCTVYREYWIRRVLHILCTVCSEYSIPYIQYTPSTTYTENSVLWAQHIWSTASTVYCINPRLTVCRFEQGCYL